MYVEAGRLGGDKAPEVVWPLDPWEVSRFVDVCQRRAGNERMGELGGAARANENESIDALGTGGSVGHGEHAAPGMADEEQPLLLQVQPQRLEIVDDA